MADPEQVMREMDKLDRIGPDGVRANLEALGLEWWQAGFIMSVLGHRDEPAVAEAHRQHALRKGYAA